MTCVECGGKMRCRYSVPIGKQLRYRAYKCPDCTTWVETCEMPERVTLNPQDLTAVRRRMRDARGVRMFFQRQRG